MSAGREFDRRGSVGELAALLPTLRATIVFPRLGTPADTPSRVMDAGAVDNPDDLRWFAGWRAEARA